MKGHLGKVMRMGEEKELVMKATEGDKSSFEKLVLKYTKGLYGYVFNMLGHQQAAQDVVQEAFVKAYKNMYSFNANKCFSTWLYTIAKNSDLNYIKANKKYEFIDVEEKVSDFDNPEAVCISNEDSKKLANAIDKLSEKYKVLIYLKYINNLSYEEISKELNISKSIVESRLYTARQKLAVLMSGGE